jgi:hypothetical protein
MQPVFINVTLKQSISISTEKTESDKIQISTTS